MTRPTRSRPESSVERFFFPQPLQLATVELDGPEAHHLLHVLRTKVGDQIGLFNGQGDEALAEVRRVGKRSAEVAITDTWTVPDESRQLTIAVALPKGDRARWLVEKATELGVTRLIPLLTERSVVDPGEGKLEKLEQTMIAACKQSGRSHVMRILSPHSWNDIVAQISQHDLTLIAHPTADDGVSTVLSSHNQNAMQTLALVGPEGGFTEQELTAAASAGTKAVRLGPFVLRVETAALSLAAAWRFSEGGARREQID